MAQTSRMMVLPLHPDDPTPYRKARVAELHDLWLRSGCRDSVMLMLLDWRHGKYAVEPVIPDPEPEPACSHCGAVDAITRGWCYPCDRYQARTGRLPSDLVLERRRCRRCRPFNPCEQHPR